MNKKAKRGEPPSERDIPECVKKALVSAPEIERGVTRPPLNAEEKAELAGYEEVIRNWAYPEVDADEKWIKRNGLAYAHLLLKNMPKPIGVRIFGIDIVLMHDHMLKNFLTSWQGANSKRMMNMFSVHYDSHVNGELVFSFTQAIIDLMKDGDYGYLLNLQEVYLAMGRVDHMLSKAGRGVYDADFHALKPSDGDFRKVVESLFPIRDKNSNLIKEEIN